MNEIRRSRKIHSLMKFFLEGKGINSRALKFPKMKIGRIDNLDDVGTYFNNLLNDTRKREF